MNKIYAQTTSIIAHKQGRIVRYSEHKV